MAALYTIMTRKGQITVPAAIRRLWGLQEGDRLAVTLAEGAHELVIRPVRSVVDATFGVVTTGPQPADLDQLRAEFEAGVGKEVAAEGLPSSAGA